jgi:hypothetical protein
MEMEQYHKIYAPFKRTPQKPNRMVMWDWSLPEFEYLADNPWIFTEKVDGTNIRVGYDGHTVQFGGRTANAQIPASLICELQRLFPVEMFEQTFGATNVTLFGEGYGGNIQSGMAYQPECSFILFDVRIGHLWLRFSDVTDVAEKLGCERVPVVKKTTLRSAIENMDWRLSLIAEKEGHPLEGIVGIPMCPLLARDGSRIIVKLKPKDLEQAVPA